MDITPEVKNFRIVAKSFVDDFLNAKDHVHQLLEGRQNLESGRFREELIRNFLRRILPNCLSVDTGFIYGFDKVANSRQIDILIWHKDMHSAVYDAGQFVIVPPESVVAVVSVKSRMTYSDLKGSLENLLSVAPLDFAFRSTYINKITGVALPPIAKFAIFYNQPNNIKEILNRIKIFYANVFSKHSDIAKPVIDAMRQVNPLNNTDPNWDTIRRAYPRLITTISKGRANYVQGWGPPEDIHAEHVYGPGLKRLPWMYRHDNSITSPLEKFVFLLLLATAKYLESPTMSITSAWGDLNPLTGCRVGDVEEMINEEGVPLLDHNSLALTSNG